MNVINARNYLLIFKEIRTAINQLEKDILPVNRARALFTGRRIVSPVYAFDSTTSNFGRSSEMHF